MYAGDWLNAVPSSALGLCMLDQEFCSSLRYWLGILLFADAYQIPVCDAKIDTMGDHQVGCGGKWQLNLFL